jgi:hypothetical protein
MGGLGTLTLRPGRQELAFGSGRLVDVREGPNVRRTFDGGRLLLQTPAWRVEGFVMRPVQDERGVFDDGSKTSQALWGVYSVGTLPRLSFGKIDLYYLGFQDDQAVYAQGAGSETRHTLGLRLWGTPNAWDYNWEINYQWGTFGAGDIQAWTVAANTGYTWTAKAWQPRVGLSTNIASGDEMPATVTWKPSTRSFHAAAISPKLLSSAPGTFSMFSRR